MSRAQGRRIAVAVLLALVGLAGTTGLGYWQFSRAHRDDIAARVLAADAMAPHLLLTPGAYVPEAAFAHRVDVRGTLDAAHALRSCNRVNADGTQGCWLLAPVDTGRGTITVVLGFAEESTADALLAELRARPNVVIEARGRLQPAELMDRGKAILLPTDTVGAINVNELAMRWNTPLLDGYAVADPAIAGTAVTSPLILPPSGITWRNLIYAWQWWGFAAFVLFLLGRYITDVRREAPGVPPAQHAEGVSAEEQS